MTSTTQLPIHVIAQQVSQALSEDLQMSPDWTANLIAKNSQAQAQIKTNQEMVVCGKDWVIQAFSLASRENSEINWQVDEGDKVAAGTCLCTISGPARGLLTAERTALNFLQTLSATATLTRQYVELVTGTQVQIMDTRKTLPGLRLAQKYAVTVGGGKNQRIGLFDGVLIKENHIIAHGGIAQVLKQAMLTTPPGIPIQIEVENFAELQEAVHNNANLILLDNMTLTEIRHCVNYCHDPLNRAKFGPITLEVSGSVNLTTVQDYARTGIDRISIGGLTKNIFAIDLSMRFI